MGETFRYQLEEGERFAIVGNCCVTLAARRRDGAPGRRVEGDVRFTLDSVVKELHGDGTVTIDSTFRQVEGEQRGGLSPGRWARRMAACNGDRVTVRKSLWGDISLADGGEKVKEATAGISADFLLRWFGGLFPRTAEEAERSQTDRLELSPWRMGIPLPGLIQVEAAFRYRATGRRVPFAGFEFPAYAVEIDFGVPAKSVGPGIVLTGAGKGTGEFLADTDRGKIALSSREGTVAFQVRTASRTLFAFDLILESRAWHEDRPPAELSEPTRAAG